MLHVQNIKSTVRRFSLHETFVQIKSTVRRSSLHEAFALNEFCDTFGLICKFVWESTPTHDFVSGARFEASELIFPLGFEWVAEWNLIVYLSVGFQGLKEPLCQIRLQKYSEAIVTPRNIFLK